MGQESRQQPAIMQEKTLTLNELRDIRAMVEDSINGLRPAIAAVTKLYNEQELKKLNIMKLASTIEVDGEKMKTADFVLTFDEILAEAVRKILDTAKNSMKTAFLLNIAVDEIDAIQSMLEDAEQNKKPKDFMSAIRQLSGGLKKSQYSLRELVSLDIEESLHVQERLNILLESFTSRNMQIKQIAANPPMNSQPLESAVIGIIDELKNTQLIKHRLDQLITQLEGEGANGK